MARNPFQQLYVGEKVDPEEFVEIFSDKLVQHALPLFQPGHVVLSGVQGSGKSMLFKLLTPEVRIAYAKCDQQFPIPKESARFIGSGININTARCNEFGNRRPEPDGIQELMFGDFFNYTVALDIIRSVRTLSNQSLISAELNLQMSDSAVADFVARVREDDVWEGYLEGVSDLNALEVRMRTRLALYRRFMNGNDKALNTEVAQSKTSAGEPMKVLVKAFRASKIVPKDVEFYVLVDQYEELATIKSQDQSADYRSVVNKMISRDPTLSYRIGTRGYAWRNHLNVFGSIGRLEQDRDYKLVEIDAKLRQQEMSSTSIYPDFANDVFLRRLKYSATAGSARAKASKIADALEKSPSPVDEARKLAGENPAAVLRLDAEWPSLIKDKLTRLAASDPLSAKLGEVWYRQKGIEGASDANPWDQKDKQYWRKERVELALLAIGSIRKQRAIFAGQEDILGLSGGNILLFLSLCQYIWDYASQASVRNDQQPELPIPQSIQTISVFQAARTWLERIPSDYGRSDDRYSLVQMLGERFALALHGDPKMSNPGQNGISLSIEDLRSKPDVFEFLIEAVDHGNLVMVEHATRNKDRKRRYKFYLNPLYCPLYRIPYQRSKEPIYLNADRLKDWLSEAGIFDRLEPRKHRRSERSETTAPLLDLMAQRRES